MEIICCGDLHLTNKNPRNRKGDYFQQLINKFEQILKITQKTDSKILLVSGDFFDLAKAEYQVTNQVLKSIEKYTVNIFAVAGQHDILFHVGALKNSPLGTLEASGAVTILKPGVVTKINNISLIGCSWNETPETKADIIVTHRMITKKGPLWPGQTDYSSASAIMRKYPWAKLILSGDNHTPHVLRLKSGRLQINSGSMMRSTKAQIDFKPRVYKVNTDTWKAKPIYLEIEKPEDVFDFEKIGMDEIKEEIKNEASEKIAKFVASLPQNMQDRPNFKLILQSLIEKSKPSKKVQEIINKTMERIS